jgi:uncharacterized protein YbbC (DUF1343 family)
MGGWTRDLWFDDTDMPWVLPSPNLPTLEAVTLYPATCLIEGTVLSEGRGTTRPFEFVGAPWVNPDHLADALRDLQLEGVLFRPVSFSPCFSKHQGAVCGGVQLYITDRDRVDWLRVGVLTLTTIKRLYPDDFAWITPTGERYFIDLLAGTADLRQAIDGDNPAAIEDLLARWTDEARAFRASRADVLLYP